MSLVGPSSALIGADAAGKEGLSWPKDVCLTTDSSSCGGVEGRGLRSSGKYIAPDGCSGTSQIWTTIIDLCITIDSVQ